MFHDYLDIAVFKTTTIPTDRSGSGTRTQLQRKVLRRANGEAAVTRREGTDTSATKAAAPAVAKVGKGKRPIEEETLPNKAQRRSSSPSSTAAAEDSSSPMKGSKAYPTDKWDFSGLRMKRDSTQHQGYIVTPVANGASKFMVEWVRSNDIGGEVLTEIMNKRDIIK